MEGQVSWEWFGSLMRLSSAGFQIMADEYGSGAWRQTGTF